MRRKAIASARLATKKLLINSGAILFTKEDNLRLVISLPVPQHEKKSTASLSLFPSLPPPHPLPLSLMFFLELASHSFSSVARQDSPYQLSRKRKGFSTALTSSHKKLRGVQLKKITKDADIDHPLTEDLIEFEERLLSEGTRFKWGVLYCKPGQTQEDELYSNGNVD